MSPIDAMLEPTRLLLDLYLENRRESFIASQGFEYGTRDYEQLRMDIEKVTNRLEEFFSHSEFRSDSHLVLGRVQSGKTAHMMGVMAALVDRPCSLVVVISGVTGALNGQTRARLQSDLANLDPDHPQIEQFPVRLQGSYLAEANIERINQLVALRVEYSEGEEFRRVPVLPVIAVLQSKARIEALADQVEDLYQKFGEKFTLVIIDDEADQASQNAAASKDRKTAIYSILEEIRESGVRNCYVGYTATPQAVLLAHSSSVLKPRLCSVIRPGMQYFGLDELMSESHSTNRIQVDQIPDDQEGPPESLRKALLDFLLKGVIQRQIPEVFYGSDDRLLGQPVPRADSIQMLVHPSARKLEHQRYFGWVTQAISEFNIKLGQGVKKWDDLFVENEVLPALLRVKQQAGQMGVQIPETLSEKWIVALVTLINQTNVVIFNSDTSEEFPVSQDDWNTRRAWVIIGGDILGRGVTLPQLVSTFFLRLASAPQFDTSSQQMRFCGYRSRFSRFVSIYAPEQIFDIYVSMMRTDRILYNYARHWDSESADLTNPRVLRMAFVGDMKPTRPGVWKGVIKKSTRGQFAFQAPRSMAYPAASVLNAGLVRSRVEHWGKARVLTGRSSNWGIYPNVGTEVVLDLMRNLLIPYTSESQERSSAMWMFDEFLEEDSLNNFPVSLAIRRLDLIRDIADRKELETTGQRRHIQGQSLLTMGHDAARTEWRSHYLRQLASSKVVHEAAWFEHSDIRVVPIGGDSHRNLQTDILEELQVDGSLLTIEPFDLDSGVADDSGIVGYGVGIALVIPVGHNITFWDVGT